MVEDREQRGTVGDETLNDVAGAGRDDYLTADRVADINGPSGVDAPASDDADGQNETENPEASTYGSP